MFKKRSPLADGNPGMSLIKIFLAGNTSGIQNFLEPFAPNSGKKSPTADVFLARKSLTSDIPGFPAGEGTEGDHYLSFLTVNSLSITGPCMFSSCL
jgi:hypothetical protein